MRCEVNSALCQSWKASVIGNAYQREGRLTTAETSAVRSAQIPAPTAQREHKIDHQLRPSEWLLHCM
jgi:hypothetical protein